MNINEMTLQQCIDAVRIAHQLDSLLKKPIELGDILRQLSERIDDLTRWIPVEEQMPTEADLNDKGYVSTYDAGYVDRATVRNGAVKVWDDGDQSWDDFDSTNREMSFTHWRRIDKPDGV